MITTSQLSFSTSQGSTHFDICLYNRPIFDRCLFQYDRDSRPNVESFFWPICFLNTLKLTKIQISAWRVLWGFWDWLQDWVGYAYIFVHNDNIFSNFCVLVDYTVPATKCAIKTVGRFLCSSMVMGFSRFVSIYLIFVFRPIPMGTFPSASKAAISDSVW